MKILLAADMEGISGVVHWDHVDPSHAEYARFCKIMTAEVNAGIRGAFDGGADEMIVTDGHNLGRNLLIEDLDPRARLNSGSASPLAMIQGVDSGVDGVIFLGYHARNGTQNAILDHTWSSRRIANVWINDLPFGEIGLNAAVSGHYNVPVIMISGDQSACKEAVTHLGSIETVIVKQAFGRMAAECLTPSAAQEKIQAGARQAVEKLARGEAPPPLRIKEPITLTVEFVNSEMADNATVLPGSQRDGRKLTFVARDMLTIYTAFQAAVTLAD